MIRGRPDLGRSRVSDNGFKVVFGATSKNHAIHTEMTNSFLVLTLYGCQQHCQLSFILLLRVFLAEYSSLTRRDILCDTERTEPSE